jgi:uncharacterized cupredoxin-like copper-binding protein
MKSSWIAAVALGLAVPVTHAFAHEGASKPKAAAAQEEVEDTPFGQAGDPGKVNRTIDIRMSDAMRFDPAEIRVHKGETVRIVAHDEGKIAHEIVIGTMDELKEHAALMLKFPNMEHNEPHMAHVEPGQRKEIVWQFTKPGEFYYACLMPGHMQAGMIGKVIVAGR